MADKTTIAHSPTSRTVTLVLPYEQADMLADYLSFAVSYQENNYGSGWDRRSEEDQQVKKLSDRLVRLSEKIQRGCEAERHLELADKTTIAHSPTSRTVTLVLPYEQADMLADYLSFAVSYQENNYGSGWDRRSEEDREAERVWKQVKKLSDRLVRLSEKIQRG